ncbi:translocation/assembly module TamB domain-containing protein [Bordetella ansorpii]|nr:translocation/assembly module TamB domain-containing protein [Bordetella ansorpii]
MLLVVALGFSLWLLGTPSGTRLLLSTAVEQLDGKAEGIEGSLLDDLRIAHLHVALPGTDIELNTLRLDVDWRALWQRKLHVRELSASAARVALATQPAADEPPGQPFTELVLPGEVVVDRLAVGVFSLTQDGQPLPVSLGNLDASLDGGVDGARVRIARLRVGHELADADVRGTATLTKLAAPWPFDAQLEVQAFGAGPDSPLCVDEMWARGGMAGAPEAQAPKPAAVKGKGGKSGAQTSKSTAKNAPGPAEPALPQPGQAGARRTGASGEAASGTDAAGLTRATLHPLIRPPYTACPVQLRAEANGSLDEIHAVLQAQGGRLTLLAQALLAPSEALPVRNATLDIQRDGKPALAATLDRQPVGSQPGVQRLLASLRAERFDLGGLLGPGMPGALLTARASVDAEVADMKILRRADVELNIEEGSRWNGQPLSGKASGHLAIDAQAQQALAAQVAQATGSTAHASSDANRQAAEPLAASPAAEQPAAQPPRLPAGWRIDGVDVDLRLGPNRVQAKGSMGAENGNLTLEAAAPRLDAFWPGVPGGAKLRAKVDGTVARHHATLEAAYTPANSRAGQLGRAPAQASLALDGGWGTGQTASGQNASTAALIGYRGTLARLDASSAGFAAAIEKPLTLAYLPGAAAPAWQTQVGATALALTFPDKQRIVLAHGGSRVGAGRWETAGQADNLVINADMVRQLRRALDPASLEADAQREANRVNAAVKGPRRIALDVAWDLRFAGALGGKVHVSRRDGDLRIPGDPPIPLGLRQLVLDLTATPTSGGASRLAATLDVRTEKMGTIRGQANAMLAGLGLDERQPIRANLDADIDDLAWVGLFTGDALEVGGEVDARLQAQGTLAGGWTASGTVRGQKLRVVRVDDGVRLIDGTLDARLDGDRFILNSLRFPAALRVMPAEWRTREWVSTNEDAKNGYIDASGQWLLSQSQGKVDVKVHRFPVLQRSDRYGMVSGTVTLDAALPRLTLTGDLTADAGWVSLEILQGVPTLDDDVRVVRAGEEKQAASSPMQIGMDVKFDMGPRFYITGMGLDAGLLGSIRIQMNDGRLTGMGALRTRGGGIEAYGQKLRLSRGVLTFQGRLENPLLDIEALRTGEQVEAGVKVSGTAQRPRIDLVSYPDVSDVEKLSWLVLGRGPDEGGNDTALLLSVGTALLGGGEPFYKQFGLDDVSVRTGSLGSSGSLLPDRTVAGDVNRDSDSELATQFIVGSKRFSNGITLSVEQALAGSETVGRVSYRLARGLSLDLKGGGVNGLALVYRVLWDD